MTMTIYRRIRARMGGMRLRGMNMGSMRRTSSRMAVCGSTKNWCENVLFGSICMMSIFMFL